MKNFEIFVNFITDASASVKDGEYSKAISGHIDAAKKYKDEKELAKAYALLEAYNKGRHIFEYLDVELKLSELLTLDAELTAASPEARDAILTCLGQKFSVEVKDAEEDSPKLSEKYKASKEALSSITEKMASSLNETMSKISDSAKAIGDMPAYQPEQPAQPAATKYVSAGSSQDSSWSAGKILGVIAGTVAIAGIAYASYSWWNSYVVYTGDDLDSVDLGI